jgi:hypothetical protein
MKRMTFGCLIATLFFLSGCSKSEHPVRGVVQVDGEPLAKGSISFVPVDGEGTVGGSPIREGQYSIDKGLPVGSYRVAIRGTRKVPGRKVINPLIPNEFMDDEVEVIPPEYNEKSTLIREVRVGANTFDFVDLKGIKSK